MNVVDLAFPIAGTSVPQDHGYALYAALCARSPALHEASWLGVHPIGGQLTGDEIRLSRSSCLRLRLPAQQIPTVLTLAGQKLDVAGATIMLSAPSVFALAPHAELDARVVLLKITRPPTRSSESHDRCVIDNDAMLGRYRSDIERQLERLEVDDAKLELCGRRTVTIKGRRLIGYSVRLAGLSPASSLHIQEHGIGGRRAMGCGIFRPTKGAT